MRQVRAAKFFSQPSRLATNPTASVLRVPSSRTIVPVRQVRSGSHLRQVGSVWYYRRAIPPDVRDAFDTYEVKFSLHTSNRREAERLEKIHDVEFEEKLAKARRYGPDGYPRDHDARIEVMTDEVLLAHVGDGVDLEHALLGVPEADRVAVDRHIDVLSDEYDERHRNLALLWADLEKVIHVTNGDWDQVRPGIVDAVKTYCESLFVEHSLDWALDRWKKAGNRPVQTERDGEEYIADFKAFTHLRALASVRRSHLINWRDELNVRGTPKAATPALRQARKLGVKTINHRLEIVAAILRTGWRDAEMQLTPDISKINLPEPANDRGAWKPEELLKALGLLEPGSGQAWLFILGLSTSTRIGETIAARKEWYRRQGFIEVPAPYTKMKKPHVVPIIGLLREPLERHLATADDGDFMFPDAPRPSNPDLKISHEISKWFSRFHAKHKIPRVIHELRDTWIEAARHNETVKKEIYEIITGHSAKTGSDGYGGERPSVLMAANEAICNDLLDADLRTAIERLIDA